MVTENGEPLVMNWDAISLDVMGSGLSVADMEKRYAPEIVLSTLAEQGCELPEVDPRAMRLVAHLTALESLVAKEAYASALGALPAILTLAATPKSGTDADAPLISDAGAYPAVAAGHDPRR